MPWYWTYSDKTALKPPKHNRPISRFVPVYYIELKKVNVLQVGRARGGCRWRGSNKSYACPGDRYFDFNACHFLGLDSWASFS